MSSAITGPDDVETFVQVDPANRVKFVRRGPVVNPVMTASYGYYPPACSKASPTATTPARCTPTTTPDA